MLLPDQHQLRREAPFPWNHATVPLTAKSHSFSLTSRTSAGESVNARSSSLLITTRRRPSLKAAATMLCAAVISAESPVTPFAATRTPKLRPRFRSFVSNQLTSALLTLLDQFLHSTRMILGKKKNPSGCASFHSATSISSV